MRRSHGEAVKARAPCDRSARITTRAFMLRRQVAGPVLGRAGLGKGRSWEGPVLGTAGDANDNPRNWLAEEDANTFRVPVSVSRQHDPRPLFGPLSRKADPRAGLRCSPRIPGTPQRSSAVLEAPSARRRHTLDHHTTAPIEKAAYRLPAQVTSHRRNKSTIRQALSGRPRPHKSPTPYRFLAREAVEWRYRALVTVKRASSRPGRSQSGFSSAARR